MSEARTACPGDRLPFLERLALLILLVVVGVRPLVSESHDLLLPTLAQPVDFPPGPGPVFPLAIGSLTLIAAMLVAWSRRRRPELWRATGLVVGGVLAAVGAMVSLFVASNRRLALTASTDWLLCAVMCVVLVQLLREAWQIRLLLCVVVATGAAFAAQCAMQRFVEIPDTIAHYEQNKERIWEKQGVPPDDARVTLYERRLYGGNVGGYLPHPNVAASFLLLAGFASVAAATGKRRPAGDVSAMARAVRLASAGLVVVMAALIFGSIILTGSRGAFLACVVACGVGVPWALLSRRLAWKVRFAGTWAILLAIGVGVLVYAQQSPAWSSMGFRWDYWRNSAKLIADYPWTGVGAENFGSFYLQYKPISSAEEIRDPHNFLVAAAAQWGLPGLLGLAAMLVGVTSRLACRREEPVPFGGDTIAGRPIGWMIAVAAGVFALRFWTIAQSPPAYQFFVTITPLAVWCVAFALTAIDGDCLAEWTNVPIGPKAGVALVIGVAAFCLHAMIDMAFFYSATATAFFALVAVAIAVRCPGQASDDGGRQLSARRAMLRLAPALIAAAWLAHGWWAWWPAWTAERPLNEARRDALAEVANPLTGRAIANFRAAEHADPWEPAAPLEAAEWLFNHAAMPHSTETPDDVRGILDEAVRMAHLAVDRDRQAINGYRILTSIHMLRGERFGTILDARATVGAAKYLYRLYPESPQDRLTLAEALVGWAKAEPDTVLYDEAIAQFERALALDAARPGERELRRWSVEMRSQIERRLADVKAARASLAASQPASE